MEKIKTEMPELVMIRNKFGTLPANVKIIFPEDNISTLSLLRILSSLEYIPASLKICKGSLCFNDKFFHEFSAFNLFTPLIEVGLVSLFSFTHSPW